MGSTKSRLGKQERQGKTLAASTTLKLEPDPAIEAANEIAHKYFNTDEHDLIDELAAIIRSAIEKEKQADLDLAIQDEAAQPPRKATSCGELRPDPRVEKALQDYDDGKALDSLPRPGTPTKEPQICDECSRKLEDGALYEDHTPRPFDVEQEWPARYLDDYMERLELLAAKINASIAAVRDSSIVWRIKESKDEEIRRLDKELTAERDWQDYVNKL